MDFPVSTGDVIALCALALSLFATWKTLRFNDRQKSLIESQERLNHLLLGREESEIIDSQRAELGASFIKLGNSQCRLKVFNRGRATARNVRIGFPDGCDVIVQSDVERKFPMESLEQHQSVELIAMRSFQTSSKHHIRLTWDDGTGKDQSKSVYATL
ncbi:MAG: hypothetical protein JJ855_00370 [Rhodospirillales bacterium]|nr:hypothetical protein [Rhodospirillales bacterium]